MDIKLITGEITNRHEKKKNKTGKMKIIKAPFPEELQHSRIGRDRNI